MTAQNTNHMTLDEIYIPHHYNAKTDKDGPVTDSGLLKVRSPVAC